MAKARKKARSQSKQKKLDRRRRRNQKRSSSRAPRANQSDSTLSGRLGEVYDLVFEERFAEAEQRLHRLYEQHPRNPAVVEAQVCLHQATENHERCREVAERLIDLTPSDPDARLIYAQESMLCGRLGIALTNLRQFLDRWPDHPEAREARHAVALLEPECEAQMARLELEDPRLDLLLMHDQALEFLQSARFDESAAKCRELLDRAPDCIPARNNLALATFHAGNVDTAVEVARETRRLAPENRFAEAILGTLCFLGGFPEEATAIADRIVIDPPTEPNALSAAIELLSFLGRDENIVVLSEAAHDHRIADSRCLAMLLHHLAVAQYRLGDEEAARSSWQRCLREMPSHLEARQNLDDLEAGGGHAPWCEAFEKWIPRAVCRDIADGGLQRNKDDQLDLVQEFPAVAALIPALLDRGDPVGREMALKMAAADGSPAMLDALYAFATGARGPDAMRHEALSILRQKGRVDAGPLRFFSRGAWTDIKPLMMEITWEARTCSAPGAQELVDTGIEALRSGDYRLAEESFNGALDIEPESCIAAYNLSLVWQMRDGAAGQQMARGMLEAIHAKFPDYVFATISLAQFAAIDGDLDRASEMLEPIINAERLHVSEAKALFAAQIQIAVKRGNLDSAEQAMRVFVHIADEDDPSVARLRRLIDGASRGNRRRQLLSRS